MSPILFLRNNLFQFEVGIVVLLFVAYCLIEYRVPLIKRMINGTLLVLIFGIPIFFTSITRSVFEVNKLLLLRVTTLFTIGLWITKTLMIDYEKDPDPKYDGKEYYSILGIRWYKTGLEIPLLIWLVINFISTILSKNIYVSIIGAYDRWEGILTVVNYTILLLIFAKLVDSLRFFYWILFSFIISAAISAFYGILQSAGIDFMQWSADATGRAFGSINNPVHYGPYIGMMICLAFGYMINVKHFEKTMNPVVYHLLNLLSFISTLVIFYAMFASWGRGTWLGMQGSLTFFLLLISKVFTHRSKFEFFVDFLFTIVVVGMVYINLLFKVYTMSPNSVIPFCFFVGFLYILWMIYSAEGKDFSVKIVKAISNFFERVLIVSLVYSTQFVAISFKSFVFYLACLTLLVLIHAIWYKNDSVFIKNKLTIVVLFSFGIISFVPGELDFVILLVFYLGFYGVFILRKYLKDKLISNLVLVILVLIFGITLVPKHSLFIRMFPTSSEKHELSVKFIKTAQGKINSYDKEVVAGKSARMSMWKSGIVWGLSNPFFGTGPDTIKEMYPFYRRVDYARLEGGHNLTPDRLHNEYVNTFATTGFLGFIARYVLVIGVYIFLIISYLYKNIHKASYYLIASTIAGFIFYQGQVLFNFGVVATASLNYMLMGLGLAIGYYGFGNETEKQQ